MRVGVLALQGGFAAHCSKLRELGHEAVEVRTTDDLEGVEGLVLPGGESLTQLKLLEKGGLESAIRSLMTAGAPTLATCAGVILVARQVSDPEQRSLGLLDVAVQRNAYGRQLDSFEATSDAGLPLVFIRAPRITEVGEGTTVVDRLNGEPVVVRQGAVVGATCHPELTASTAVHESVFGRVNGSHDKAS